MIYALDLDGVLLNTWTGFNAWFSNRFGIDFQAQDVWNYDFQWTFGCSKSDINQMWSEIWDYPQPAYVGAAEFIRSLKSFGYKVVCVSSRGSHEAKVAALRDISNNNLAFDEVILMDVKKVPKSRFINRMQAQFFIEDSIPNAVDCADNCLGTQVLLITRPWNARSFDVGSYVRISSYVEALELANPNTP
jgi:uncharacterized HAD superfamily protein